MTKNNIHHLAIVMDGNARWAKREGLEKSEGHRKGAENIRNLLPRFVQLDIPNLTLYAFSFENWKRSKEEVEFIIELLMLYLNEEIDELQKNSIKVKFVGDLSRLSDEIKKNIADAEEITKDNTKLNLFIAFSYGGRKEITDACQKIIDLKIKEIDQDSFGQYLYAPQMPDVDLFIRPSGEFRMSNFLIWQSAYAEFYFTKKYWPEFTFQDLEIAIEDYKGRKRNFGGRY